MADQRTANPRIGTTDWAAKQFLRILEREEREKVARRAGVQLAQADAQDSSGTPVPPQKPTPPQELPGVSTTGNTPSWRRDPRATGFIEEILSEEGLEANRP